jgi:hypothetical protein
LLAVLATQTTGCIITSDGGDDFATINAEWSFHTVNPTGAVSPPNSCPAGFNTVALHNQLVDANFRPIGDEVIDLFDCIDMRNFTDELDPGVYETFISVTTDSGGTIYADSLIETIDVSVTDDTFRTQIIDNGGYFKLGWDLREQGSNRALACADLAVGEGVGLTATLASNTAIFVADDFDCEDGEEFFTFTAPVAKGTYDVAIQPVNSAGASIGPSVVLDDKVMGDRNDVTELGVVTLLFP